MRRVALCGLMVLAALAFSWWPGRASLTQVACAAPAGEAHAREKPEEGCGQKPGSGVSPRTSRGPYMTLEEIAEAAARAAEADFVPASAATDKHPWPTGSTGSTRYTVQEGDTLWDISVHFGISVSMIQSANDLGPYGFINPGMELDLPASNQPGSALAGPSGPIVRTDELHFVASISQQKCWLFKDRKAVETWTCSTGRADSPSIPGNYTVQSKMQRAPFYAAESWMPYWLGIYDAPGFENGIHGLPFAADTGEKFWTDKIGVPITFGCIMLEDANARELFDVSYAGMPVTILP